MFSGNDRPDGSGVRTELQVSDPIERKYGPFVSRLKGSTASMYFHLLRNSTYWYRSTNLLSGPAEMLFRLVVSGSWEIVYLRRLLATRPETLGATLGATFRQCFAVFCEI